MAKRSNKLTYMVDGFIPPTIFQKEKINTECKDINIFKNIMLKDELQNNIFLKFEYELDESII